MLLAMLITLALLPQAGPGSAFEIDLWPGEGVPVFEAITTRLKLHEHPSESSKVVRTLTVQPKQRLVFDDTRYRTIKAGKFLVLASTNVRGRTLGDIHRLSSVDFPFAIATSICLNTVTICSGLYLGIGISYYPPP